MSVAGDKDAPNVASLGSGAVHGTSVNRQTGCCVANFRDRRPLRAAVRTVGRRYSRGAG